MPIGYKKEIDVNIQSQIGQKFQYYAVREIKTDITLTSDIPAGTTVIPLSTGHGFLNTTVGEKISIFDGEFYIQGDIKAHAANSVTLYSPTPYPFSSATAQVIRGNAEMRNDNSGGVDYLWKPRGATIPIDISKAIVTFECGAAVPDMGKFGGAAALTNKMYFRKVNGGIIPLGTYGKNRDFEDLGADVKFSDKAPAGTNGVIITFDIELIFGQVERFYPAIDYFLAHTEDNYAVTGIESMSISLIGSYTSGEI